MSPTKRAPEIAIAAAAVLFFICGLWRIGSSTRFITDIPGTNPIEGAVVASGLRLLHFENPYPDPVAEKAVAFLYPPAAPTILAFAWPLLGGGFFGPRLLSFLAVAGAGILLGYFAFRATGGVAALFAAGAWFSLQPVFDNFLFFARVDGVGCFLLILALLSVSRAFERNRGFAVAGLIASAAILTKPQLAVVPAAAVILFIIKRDWRSAAYYCIPLTVVLFGTFGALHVASNGWSTRTMLLASRHPLVPSNMYQWAARFSEPDMLGWILFVILGFRGAPRILQLSFLLSIPLCAVTAAKWGGIFSSQAPLVLLGIGCGSFIFTQNSARESLRWVLVLLQISWIGAILYIGGLPSLSPEGGESLQLTRNPIADALAAVERTPGPILTFGCQESGLLLHRPVDDDLHAAMEFDVGGYPVIRRIGDHLQNKKYTVLVGATPALLRAWAVHVRAAGRDSTGDELERCAKIIETNYKNDTATDFVQILK